MNENFRVKNEIPMTRTYKYKKGEVSRESIECGDYFVDKNDNVTVIDDLNVEGDVTVDDEVTLEDDNS